jgi:hypothetical protein
LKLGNLSPYSFVLQSNTLDSQDLLAVSSAVDIGSQENMVFD